MRLISTRLHALLDYSIALLSILSPILFSIEGQRETIVLLSFGMLIILYSFFTDYNFGMSRQIPMWLHLRMDQLAGLMMMTTPWVLNFDETIYLPHVLMGLSMLVNSLLTTDEILVFIHYIRQRPWEKWFRMPSEQ